MGGMEDVCVQAKLTVVPSRAVTPGKVHQLSNLDYMMQLHRVRMVYYYRKCAEKNVSDLIPSLKESLSQALSDYPAATGRLQRRDDGNWDVRCNDAGVRVLEAKANTTIDQWLESVDRSSELKLAHWEDIGSDPGISSLLYVQLTEFEGGGLAIGLSCAHILADPSCATLIMKAWGETHRGKLVLHPPFLHPPSFKARPQLNTDSVAIKYYGSTFPCALDPKSRSGMGSYETVTFKFSEEMVKECISEVQRGTHQYGDDARPFEALAALFWTCYVRAKGMPSHEESHLSICSEFRKIIMAPLPHGYFGNALHFTGISTTVDHLSSNDLSYPSRMIRESVDQIEKEEVRSVIEWLEMTKRNEGRMPPPFFLYGPRLTCANWENFYTYDAVFEEGKKPVRVSYHVEPLHGEGLILILPALEGGLSRTVMVTLPSNQIAKLCEDPVIRRFSPGVQMKKATG